jgi:predicted TIM-barrel fold metal-dependent hydrolase
MVETHVSFEQMVRLGQAVEGEVVIDSHIHMGVNRFYYVPQPEAGRLAACMDRYGIQLGCASSFSVVGSDYAFGNDLVAAAVRDYPERFFGYIGLNANYPEELIGELERGDQMGLRGIKLITAYQGHPEETERFFPVYEWANSRRKIILSHQWGAPSFLAHIAQRYPDVCFLIGHLNLNYAEVVRRFDNVYTTTTYVPWPGSIELAVERFGAPKILFGTDIPDLDPALNLGPLLTARISDGDKRLILGLTMQRILATYG